MTSTSIRPLLAFTPNQGWLNDPNGQFYDRETKTWHLYYQYYPDDIVWKTPLYWGHATSKDLSIWEDHGAALGPDNPDEGVFTGNIVIDYDNTSGFFDSNTHPSRRVVAIYTYEKKNSQTQYIAYSLDGGYTFVKYCNNPVLDVNSSNFRDPKVFWHLPTKQWIMVIAKTQEFKVEIYGSLDLKSWKLHSSFSSGIYGFQYECPSLVEVPIENSRDTKWVMIVAINPGSPLGGSANQYFVGSFDGYSFIADDSQARLMDYGKDFYAFQVFENTTPDQGVIGLAWASNWQYAHVAPTSSWRGSMTLPRKLTLASRKVNPDTSVLSLLQEPVYGKSVSDAQVVQKRDIHLATTNTVKMDKISSGTFLFDITFKIDESIRTNGLLQITCGNKGVNESVRSGFDLSMKQFFVDRSNASGLKENPFFTDKTSAYVDPLTKVGNSSVYKFLGIIDGNLIEIYLNNGIVTLTNTFFLEGGVGPDYLKVSTTCDDIHLVDLKVCELKLR